ncbi:hypothetical protein MVEN_01727600 [Mycena venus]|uniref:Uncharacterized protein n=1 Tax=Mycena venus TaxID=2733690 RepID=A0A8H6XJY3_9AGAR|nr:hypothetical protein MVEN_01727600 [Mycena venus]
MPVTFCPATHRAESRDVKPVTSSQILQQACPHQFKQAAQIMQYSIGGQSEAADTLFKVVPNENGFVNTVMSAYNQHHALVIRPDDVWLAIVSQFSFYVNGNAELLRANFVAHEGKRELVVVGPRDFALLSRQMADMIHKNVVDPALREWILPKFSTTTLTDTTIGSMLLMATTKKYFDFTMVPICGIPRMTLEGEQRDWEQLLHRLAKLKEYGLQTIAWYHLLFPIISRFVKAFEDPDSRANYEFWQKVACDETFGVCGIHESSGWITAFCVFSIEGHWRGPKLDTDRPQSRAPESMSSRRFWSSYTRPLQETRPHLTLDGTEYPVVSLNAVPSGYGEVDVKVVENTMEYPCVIVAGLVGMGFSSSRDLSVSKSGKNDTVRPVLAWWMYSKLDGAEIKRREQLARHWAYAPVPPPNPGPGISFPSVQPFIPPPDSPRNGTTGGGAGTKKATRRQSTPATPSRPVVVLSPPPTQSTMRWVTDQSRGETSRFVEQGISASQTSSHHGRRRSESAVRAGQTINPELPVRKRRTSILQRLFKF